MSGQPSAFDATVLSNNLIDTTHRELLDPWSHVHGHVKTVRRFKYNANKRADNYNRWWLEDSGGDDSLFPHALTDAEQRAEIEKEPAFKSSFLLSFGDPSGMLKELVLLPDVDERGEVVKGSGAYVGPTVKKGCKIESLKPKPLQQLRKGHTPVHFGVANPRFQEQPARRRPASARPRTSSPALTMTADAAEKTRARQSPRGAAAVVAAAFAATLHAGEPPAAAGADMNSARDRAGAAPGARRRPASAGVRGAFGGNPLSRTRSHMTHGPDADTLHALSLGPVGQFIPLAVPTAPRAALSAGGGDQPRALAPVASAHVPQPSAPPMPLPATDAGASVEQQHTQLQAVESDSAFLGTQRNNRRNPLSKGSRQLGASLRPPTSAGHPTRATPRKALADKLVCSEHYVSQLGL